MMMTDAEIIREYREAKTPLKQIGILADENQCSRGKIVDILRAAGVELPAVYREKPGNAPHPSPAGDTFPQGKAETGAGGDLSTASRSPSPEGEAGRRGPSRGISPEGEAEWGPILPAPKLAGFAERVNDGAVEVIARLLAVSDASPNAEGASLDFQEQVRGVLALVHELRGGNGE